MRQCATKCRVFLRSANLFEGVENDFFEALIDLVLGQALGDAWP
jgi:hypothetical protein